MKSALVLACLSLVAASHVAACSSPDSSGSGGAGGSGESSTSEAAGPGSTTGNSGATTGPSGATTGPASAGATTSSSGGGSECSAQGTWELCDDCECGKNQAGCDAYYELEDDQCYCGANAPCAAACAASYCGDMDLDPDAACDTCMQGLDDTCYDAASAACDADPNCKAYSDATFASCDSLPDM